MPGPKVRAAKKGVSAITGDLVDMAFDSDYNLNKVARCVSGAGDSPETVAHGFSYTPKAISLLEFSSGKFGHVSGISMDDTNVYPGGFGVGYDEYAHIFVDQLTSGIYKKDMTGKPAILIGDGTEGDHNYKLHSGYDTFKVAKTGTLSISAPVYAPGTSGGTQTLTATYSHGLGYVPLFGPFVEWELIWGAYKVANSSFYYRLDWTTSTQYYTGDLVDSGASSYKCILSHTSASITEPGVGANWATYWEVVTPEDPWVTGTSYAIGDAVYGTDGNYYRCTAAHTSGSTTRPVTGASYSSYWVAIWHGYYGSTVYVNALEDNKFSGIGGWEPGNDAIVRFYATSTQLVLELERTCSPQEEIPTDPPIIVSYYEPYHTMEVTVDYTIFYNRIDEEFNLL